MRWLHQSFDYLSNCIFLAIERRPNLDQKLPVPSQNQVKMASRLKQDKSPKKWSDNLDQPQVLQHYWTKLELKLLTWTRLAALSHCLQGALTRILTGTRDAFAVLQAVSASAEDTFQDLPQNWVPHVSMGVGLAIVQTRWWWNGKHLSVRGEQRCGEWGGGLRGVGTCGSLCWVMAATYQ